MGGHWTCSGVKKHGGVKDCQFRINKNRGAPGTDFTYTCKDGTTKYLFAYDGSSGGRIYCVHQDHDTRYGLKGGSIGSWKVKLNPNTQSSEQVLDSNAKTYAYNCGKTWWAWRPYG